MASYLEPLQRAHSPQPAKHCRQAEPAGNALAVAVQNRDTYLLKDVAIPLTKERG